MIKDHKHGVAASDCSHPACKAALHRCQKASKLRRLNGETALADAAPVRLHIATLRGAGWSLRAIAAESGISPTTLSRIATPDLGRRQTLITRAIAQKIMVVRPDQIPVKGSRPGAEPFVSRIGTHRRLQALLAIGWTHRELEARGVCSRNLLHQQGQWVTRTTHDKVAALYRRLCTERGPSQKTIRWATKLGYLSPVHWDDIDRDHGPIADLDESGAGCEDAVDESAVLRVLAGDDVPTNAAERREIVRRWTLATGRPLNDLERLTGWRYDRYSERSAEDAA